MMQFLAWVADRPRTYRDAMEAWRSTCPRMSVWEDAIIDGLVRLDNGAERTVVLTSRGRAVLSCESVANGPAEARPWGQLPLHQGRDQLYSRSSDKDVS